MLSSSYQSLKVSSHWHAFKQSSKSKGQFTLTGFPSRQVMEAYLNPAVDESEERFTWGLPDLQLLRQYPCTPQESLCLCEQSILPKCLSSVIFFRFFSSLFILPSLSVFFLFSFCLLFPSSFSFHFAFSFCLLSLSHLFLFLCSFFCCLLIPFCLLFLPSLSAFLRFPICLLKVSQPSACIYFPNLTQIRQAEIWLGEGEGGQCPGAHDEGADQEDGQGTALSVSVATFASLCLHCRKYTLQRKLRTIEQEPLHSCKMV